MNSGESSPSCAGCESADPRGPAAADVIAYSRRRSSRARIGTQGTRLATAATPCLLPAACSGSCGVRLTQNDHQRAHRREAPRGACCASVSCSRGAEAARRRAVRCLRSAARTRAALLLRARTPGAQLYCPQYDGFVADGACAPAGAAQPARALTAAAVAAAAAARRAFHRAAERRRVARHR